MKKFLLLVLPFSLLFAEDPELDQLSATTALGGPEIYDVVKNARTVTAQRVDSKVAENKETAEENPKLIILGDPFKVSDQEAVALKHVFTKGSTYLSPSKTCEFRANVRYGFAADDNRKVEMVLCFGCGELTVWQGEKMVSFGPFDGGYSEILDITKRLFPKDEFLAKFDAESFKLRAARMHEVQPK